MCITIKYESVRSIERFYLGLKKLLFFKHRHKEAVKHVKLALELLELAKSEAAAAKKGDEGEENQGDQDDLYEEKVSPDEKMKTILTTIVIAYYNFGTELEYLKDY